MRLGVCVKKNCDFFGFIRHQGLWCVLISPKLQLLTVMTTLFFASCLWFHPSLNWTCGDLITHSEDYPPQLLDRQLIIFAQAVNTHLNNMMFINLADLKRELWDWVERNLKRSWNGYSACLPLKLLPASHFRRWSCAVVRVFICTCFCKLLFKRPVKACQVEVTRRAYYIDHRNQNNLGCAGETVQLWKNETKTWEEIGHRVSETTSRT